MLPHRQETEKPFAANAIAHARRDTCEQARRLLARAAHCDVDSCAALPTRALFLAVSSSKKGTSHSLALCEVVRLAHTRYCDAGAATGMTAHAKSSCGQGAVTQVETDVMC